MNILLLGKNGQVGWDLQFALLGLGSVYALDFPELDFEQPDQLLKAVREASPDVIVNAGAYTNVERAEDEPDKANRINGDAPGVLAEAARSSGALLVHYSTDYVYDGSSTRPYVESDPTAPLNTYGRSKLRGDEAIRSSGCWSRILRTSWVYSGRGANFVRAIVTAAAGRKPLRIIGDQTGTPTWSRWLALVTREIIVRERLAPRKGPDVYHTTGSGSTSWHGFSLAFLSTLGFPADTVASVKNVRSSEYPTKAQRPANGVLSNQKLARDYGIHVPAWDEQLRLALRETSIEQLCYPRG